MTFGFLRAFALTLMSWVVELLGLIVVWLALPYRKSVGDRQAFSQFPQWGEWQLVRLPKWALWWDNAFDGMLGDKRGWWANYCAETYGKAHTDLVCMWKWAALRNPGNYFGRNVCGVDVSTLTIQQVAGTIPDEGNPPYRGWYLLRSTDGNWIYPRFYLEYAFSGTHGLMMDFGWKIKLSHNGTSPAAPEKDRIKGIVAVISPWKELS